MRAAIYARVSTGRQERDQTIDSQLTALRHWAAGGGHDLRDEHVFTDEGYSGSRLDRPGLDRLRDAAAEGAFDVVAVYSPDRLARKYAYQALLLEEFRKAGCEVAFVQRPISDDPHDQLLLQIQGAVAEYERAVLGERFRRGKLQKARAGQWTAGQAPYGYRYIPKRDGVPGHLVIDDAEAAVVRLLYRWLIDEQMTVRQILKRLAAGPWRPRSGRRLWSNSVVHRILSDPVYTGTGYHNRYSFEVPKRPRTRGPRSGERTCRRPRPREEWVAIPVPPIIDETTYEQASAQLARNSVLSFRNNTRHDYLLRCLLTCKTCGLSMFGVTVHAADGTPRWRYYRCHGRDCVSRDRDRPCPQRQAKVEELDAAVWEHIKGLLNDPVTLLGQFEAFAGDAEEGAADECAQEEKWTTQLRRLGREEQRLLDAYQAEVIDLAELKERRQRLAGRREALTAQRDQQARLRAERGVARETLADLRSFCERIRCRLDEATLAEKQRLLHLLIERVIVGEDTLEIRHVIPLRRLQPEALASGSPDGPGEGPGTAGAPAEQGGERLRSDGVRPTQLMPVLRQVVVDFVAVAGQHTPVALAQQFPQRIAVATADDLIDRGHLRHHHPQPTAPTHRGLIDVGRLLPGRLKQFVHDRLQLPANVGLGGADLAGAQRDGEQIGQQASGLVLAQPVSAGQQGASGLQAGTVLPGRGLSAGGHAAAGAEKAMASILGDAGAEGRNVPDLMTQRLRIVAVQGLAAVAAGAGLTFQHAVGPVVEGALGLGMSALSAGLVGRGRLGRCAFESRRIRRGWLGGVGGVLVEALPEFRHLLVQFLKALLVALDQSQDG
jgi:site-specific DNA recombinase